MQPQQFNQPTPEDVMRKIQSIFRVDPQDFTLMERAILRAQREFLSGLIEVIDHRIGESSSTPKKPEHVVVK